jgi:hypothetical protein
MAGILNLWLMAINKTEKSTIGLYYNNHYPGFGGLKVSDSDSPLEKTCLWDTVHKCNLSLRILGEG